MPGGENGGKLASNRMHIAPPKGDNGAFYMNTMIFNAEEYGIFSTEVNGNESM